MLYGASQYASAVLEANSAGDAVGSPDATATGGGRRRGQQYESLRLNFASAALATGIVIRQSQGAGSVRQVELIDTGGVHHEIWVGTDPSTASDVSDLVLR